MSGNAGGLEMGSRRAVLAGAAALGGAAAVGAGAWYVTRDGEPDDTTPGLIGYGRSGRQPPGGTPMGEMPDLEGELDIYSGRGQFLVGALIDHIDELYENFNPVPRYGGSTDLVNQILNEGSGTPADVFYSVNAGALGVLADEGRTRSLPDELREIVREEFQTEDWVGTSGRARTVPYNTEAVDGEDLPTDIMAYQDLDLQFGWAPGYGSAQAFITAMRLLEGETATRQWVSAVADRARTYDNELAVCEAIANGEVEAGFTNHYYIQRVLDANEDAPIATHFTQGDAGAVFNVAGAAVIDETDDPELAQNFVRHLLSAEAQDYFARVTFEYPLIPEVEPIGDLPPIDELDVPDIDLTALSDLQPTVDLLRDEGVDL